MIFLTIDGHHVDLQKSTRIATGQRAIKGRLSWVILVWVGGVSYPLVSTGNDKLQAQFHCSALKQCKQNGTL